ncbi:unnamed protein product, partial [Onchocerca flexuosa]|uniref:RBR-type E3 ubiquitin transferase n=1 Tax=Onchocerca flexuosa TaxID=387005 RepID=A0A183HG20_9BILA
MSQIETATPTQLEEIYRKFGKKQLEQLLETLKSEKWIRCNSKPCPSCQAKIEKGSGCNKITCIKCGHCFCWLCGIVLNKNDPYSHFNTRGSCYNRLFEGVDEEDWNNMIRKDVVVIQMCDPTSHHNTGNPCIFICKDICCMYKLVLKMGQIWSWGEVSNENLMPSLNWKHYTAIFASVSGTPVFCYWYYSLPHVVDRF